MEYLNIGILQSSEIELSIYNSHGQKIAILDKGFRQKGEYLIKCDVKNLVSGIYYIKIKTNKGLSQTKKVVFVK